jgi:type IV secretory pathway component VirB8
VFISYITAEAREQKVQMDDLFKNPTGFTAINYRVVAKNNSNYNENKDPIIDK